MEPSADQLHEGAAARLKVLTDLERITTRLGMAVWLRGGWTIDFLVGAFTRPMQISTSSLSTQHVSS